MKTTVQKRTALYMFLALLVIITVGGTIIANTSVSVDKQLMLGEKYLLNLEYEKAIITFEKILQVDKKNVDAYLGMADAYIGLEELDKAEAIIYRGLEEVQDNNELLDKLIFIQDLIVQFKPELDKKNDLDSNRGQEVEFVNNKEINIQDYEELDRKTFDLTGDGEEEVILLLGKGERFMLDECYLAVLNNKETEVLTVVEGDSADVIIESFGDITGDGIAEIVLYGTWGGSAGGWNRVLEFSNGTYVNMEYNQQQSLNVSKKFSDNYQYTLEFTIDGEIQNKTAVLFHSQVENLMKSNIYNQYGNLLSNPPEINHDIGSILEDINDDGKLEWIDSYYISVTCNACSEIIVNPIYEYEDGSLVLVDVYIHSSLENLQLNYKKYKQVQDAKSLIYEKYQTNYLGLELRYYDLLDELNDQFIVFKVLSDPYSPNALEYSEYLLVEKNTDQLFYLSTDEEIIKVS